MGYKDSELGIAVTQFTSSPLSVEHPLLVKYSKLRSCTFVQCSGLEVIASSNTNVKKRLRASNTQFRLPSTNVMGLCKDNL